MGEQVVRKDRLPLLWKTDQIAKPYTRSSVGKIYGVNQATCVVEPDKFSKKGVWHAEFITAQPGFCLERALYNHRRLAEHFVEVFRKMYHNLRVEQFLPPRADQRCHLLSFALIWWELFALFTPDQIKVDLFDILCCRGGACFQTYCTPCGLI